MSKLDKLVDELSTLTVLEAAELSKLLEEKWGVSAAAPVAIAYAPDPVSAAKVSTQYAKDNEKFVVVGGLMGEVVLDQKGISALATLPSLDELRGKIVGLLQAPAGQLARVVGAYAAKDAA